ncbi:MAG TPA: hypothetical protein VGI00_03685 [Streptosporangiaceae bacterium]
MTPDTWPTSRRIPSRTTAILAAAGLVVVGLIVAVVATRSAGGTGPAGPGPGTRAVSVTAGPAGTVDLEGVPGQLTITAAATGQIRLTGHLHWSGHAPLASVHASSASSGPGAAGRTLHLDYVCASGSPCTEDYRLSVPANTAVVLSQPSGHVTLRGLAGPVRITAANVDVSASALRSPSLTAGLTSGHLSAVFVRAPRRVSLALTSAQATVWLPGVSPGYQVSQQVASGYVHVGVARAPSSPYQVQAQVTSGELELLPPA